MRIGEYFSRPVFNLSLPAWRQLRAQYADAQIPRLLDARFKAAGRMLWVLQRLQGRLFRDSLNEVKICRPVFILGHWRSGTTLLHEILALDDRFVMPNTFQCFNPHRFLLTSSPGQAEVARPTRDLVVTPSSPQEDEFALLCLGARSPYEAFLFPESLKKLEDLCDPDCFADDDAQAWGDLWTDFLRGVLHANGKEKRLLLKSPSHSMRVPTIARLFPDAVFISLTRDAEAVFISTVKMWKTMWERYAIGLSLSRTELEQCVARIHQSVAAKLRAAGDLVPTDRFVTISYEDLIADPPAAIAELYRKLELDEPAGLPARHAHYLAAANAWRSDLAPSAMDRGDRESDFFNRENRWRP